MKHLLLVLALVAAPLAGAVAPAAGASAAAAPTSAPVHSITVSGTSTGEATMWPAYSDAVERYAVKTSDDAGTVTVTASTSDPAGVIRIDGRPEPSGSRTLTGLQEGDEIAVFIQDSSGTETHSLIYVPGAFPTLGRAAPGGALGNLDTPSPGLVMLTLGLYTAPSSFYETAVDANGVPAMVHTVPNAEDLKPLPQGGYSVARATTTPGRTGDDIVQLDDQFREVTRYRTVGLTDTDGHDSILLPNGDHYLLASEPNPTTGLTDAVIQEVAADGTKVLFQWSTADHVDPATESMVDAGRAADGKNPDYAHINSIELVDGGQDLLVSFRHLSSVFKIARIAHDGYAEGDVIWKLGGRDSSFTFTDLNGDPDGGPCAQHTATQLANGDILTFDDGSAQGLGPLLCVDPADPTGASVQRTPTRIAEWSLDQDTGVATMVHDYIVGKRFAIFAGSAQRLDDGDTLIGWAASTDAVASEVDADGALLWDLSDVTTPTANPRYFTYRAVKTAVPDDIDPVVSLDTPAGATYVQNDPARPVVDCTDRGGSSLRTCSSTFSTAVPGTHTWTVTATDGAGNTTTASRTYRVLPFYRPDAMIRTSSGAFHGAGIIGGASRQHVSEVTHGRRGSAVAVVRLHNDGTRWDRLTWEGSRRLGPFTATYGASRALHGRTPLLRPGQSWTLRIKVSRATTARVGVRRTFDIRTHSLRDPGLSDTVGLRVRIGR